MKTFVKLIIVVVSSCAIAACQSVLDSEIAYETNDGITIKSDVGRTKSALSGVWLEYPMGLYAVMNNENTVSMYAENRKYDGSGYSASTVFKPVSGSLPWPSAGTLRFIGYSPYNENAICTVNGDESNWTVDLKIPVDNNKDDQDDLVGYCDMTGIYNCASHDDEPVSMRYDHLMSRVQIELWSNTPKIIKDVTMNNVCLSATQKILADANTSSWDGTWIDKASPVSYGIGNGCNTNLHSYKVTPIPPCDGGLVKTGLPLDLGLDDDTHNGPGSYFQVAADDGTLLYTRNGRFHLDEDRTVVDENGYILQPEFAVPEESERITVSLDGHIAALDRNGEEIAAAEIPLFKFISALKHYSGRYFIPWDGSGAEVEGVPGEENFSRILQGYWNSTDENYYKIGDHFDLYINGEGYFQLDVDGELLYTRDNNFRINQDGTVVDENGYILQPEFAVPEETWELMIYEGGHMCAFDADLQELAACEIPLYTFDNPEKLAEREIGGKIYYEPTDESGFEVENVPGTEGTGTLLFGYRSELVMLYTETEPLKYGRTMLCIPDRKASETSSPERLQHSISVEIATPAGMNGCSGTFRTITIPIDDEWLQGASYTYKIDCSDL